jgi:hypothetical protein
MSDTPETDHIESNLSNSAHPILLCFCRKLERERDKAFALLASEKATRNHIVQRAAETERERDEAVQALRNIRADWGGMVIDDGCYCSDCEFLRPIDSILNKYKA